MYRTNGAYVSGFSNFNSDATNGSALHFRCEVVPAFDVLVIAFIKDRYEFVTIYRKQLNIDEDKGVNFAL